jgi:DNA-binding NtrC family response regulator
MRNESIQTNNIETNQLNPSVNGSLRSQDYQQKFDNFSVNLGVSLKELETEYIQAFCKANSDLTQEEVASGLGINRKTLYRKLQGIRAKASGESTN